MMRRQAGYIGMLILVAAMVLSACAPAVGQTPRATVPVPREAAAVTTPEGATMTFKPTTLRQGDQWPTRGEPLFALITGPEGWATFLKQHRSSPEQWPAVDWEHNVVLVALMGGKRTGGFGITITDLLRRENVVTVQVQERTPQPGEMVIQVLTSPYHVVTVPREAFPAGEFTLVFQSPSGVWQVKVPSLDQDGVFRATRAAELPGTNGDATR